jgi:hypothetical protein
VIAAGEESLQQRNPTFAPLHDVGLVVGATDTFGKQANFSKWPEYAVGAPGIQVPLIASDTGKLKYVDGASYAAAFAAGAAALLKGAHPEAKPADIVKAFQETSNEKFAGGPRIINVKAALDWLNKVMATRPPGATHQREGCPRPAE